MRKIATLFAICALFSCCTSCYRMPAEDEYSLIPGTNNRDITRESSQSALPGLNL